MSESNGVVSLDTPHMDLDGWEQVYALDGTRWFGKVVSDSGDTLVMKPAFESSTPTSQGVLVPQIGPKGQPVGMEVQWTRHPGGELTPVLVFVDSMPSATVRWAARVRLSEMSRAARGKLRQVISTILDAHKQAVRSESLAADFGGTGAKVT